MNSNRESFDVDCEVSLRDNESNEKDMLPKEHEIS